MSGQSYLCQTCSKAIDLLYESGPGLRQSWVWVDARNAAYGTTPVWHKHMPRGDLK